MEAVEQGVVAGDRRHILGQPLLELDVAHGDRLGDEVSALDVDIAGQRPEDADRPGVLKGVELHVEAVAVDDAGGLGRGVQAGGLRDGGGVEPEIRRDLLRREGLGGLLQFVESDGPFPDEIGIVTDRPR